MFAVKSEYQKPLTSTTGWMDFSLSHLNTVIQRSGEHTPNAVNMQTYGVHKYFILHEKRTQLMSCCAIMNNSAMLHFKFQNTFTLMDAPVKQQSQASKKQRVKNMIDDLWLLSYSSIFKPEVGFHRLATVWKSKWNHDTCRQESQTAETSNCSWSQVTSSVKYNHRKTPRRNGMHCVWHKSLTWVFCKWSAGWTAGRQWVPGSRREGLRPASAVEISPDRVSGNSFGTGGSWW